MAVDSHVYKTLFIYILKEIICERKNNYLRQLSSIGITEFYAPLLW